MNETLRQRLERAGEPLPDLETLTIVLEAAALLRAAHEAGRAHGELTPEDILLERGTLASKVRIEGMRDNGTTARRRSDVSALTGLMFTCLTGQLPPYARRSGEADDPSRLDDPRWHWEHVDRRRRLLGLARWTARPCDEGFATLDEVVTAFTPCFRAEADALSESDPQLLRTVEFKEEVDHQRERRERLAERLRFLDEWFETHAETVERCDRVHAQWSARSAELRALTARVEATFGPQPVAPPEVTSAPPEVEAEAAEPVVQSEPEAADVLPPSDNPPATIVTDLPTYRSPIPAEPTEVLPRSFRTPPPALAAIVLLVAGLVGWVARPGDATERSGVRGARAAQRVPAAPPPPRVEVTPTAIAPQVGPAHEAVAAVPEPAPTVSEPLFQDDAGVTPPEITKETEPVPEAVAEAPVEAPPAPEEPEEPEPLGSHMVAIPSASVSIGKETVEVEDFLIDRAEVSQAAYLECHEAGKCALFERRWDTGQHPATGVTREMATRYCAHRGARLPTASEWALAAAGPEGHRYPWGNDYAKGRMNRRSGDTYRYVAPVEAFAEQGASDYGVIGMAGNVREWTATDGKDGAVVAGPGYRDSPWLPATHTQVVPPDTVLGDLGFRCAK